MPSRARVALKGVVWVACLAPLAVLAFRFRAGDLGANPIDFVTDWLGIWALRLLLASLALTPLRIVFGLSWPVTLRRLLGLFACFYVALHLATWVVLDHFLDWPVMLADIVKRPYITAGMAAFVLLLPLAATSTAGMVKRLGGRAWRRLHRLVYASAVLAALHFVWLAKVGRVEPYVYAGILGVLLGVRVVDVARRRLRQRCRNGRDLIVSAP